MALTNTKVQIRLALVLFGGLSLAVYMNGIAQEILALLRASQALQVNRKRGTGKQDPELEAWAESERRNNPYYYALLEAADAEVVADVIAGASAGGLNGLLLAKALAHGVPDMSAMTDLWLNVAQIDLLAKADKDPTAMMSGQFLQENLEQALKNMSHAQKPFLADQVRILDLFVPSTDVHGHRWQRQDEFDQTVEGMAHKYIFHLKKRSRFKRLGYDQNDFTESSNGLLAKIGRATSAFPGAFPAVRISQQDGLNAGVKDLLENVDGAEEGIWFADGGILLNKPFEPVLQSLQGRYANKDVRRVLAYLEPDPEVAESKEQTPPHVLETAAAGFMLPMSQDIYDSLELLDRENERRRNREQTLAAKSPALEAELRNRSAKTELDWQECCVRLARLKSVLDETLNTALAGLKVDPKERRRAVRAVLEQIPQLQTIPTEPPSASEEGLFGPFSQFVAQHDLEYRIGRIRYLMERVRREQTDESQTWGDKLNALREALEIWTNARWSVSRAGRLPEQAEAELPEEERAEKVRWAVLLNQAMQEMAGAAKPGQDVVPAAAQVVTALAQYLNDVAKRAGDKEEQGGGHIAIPSETPMYSFFATFRDFAAEGEGEIGLFRFSPTAACGWVNRPVSEKLAGVKAGHFSAFFSRRWRANDIMWGRLDGAELLARLVVQESELVAEKQAEAARTLDGRRRQILAESPEALDLAVLRQMVDDAMPAPVGVPAATLRPGRDGPAWDATARREAAVSVMTPETPTAVIWEADPDTLQNYMQNKQDIGKEGFGQLEPRQLAGEILLVLNNAAAALAQPAPENVSWVENLQTPLGAVIRPLGWLARLLLVPRQGILRTVQDNVFGLMSLGGVLLLVLQVLQAIVLGWLGWTVVLVLLAPYLLNGLWKSNWVRLLVTGALLVVGGLGRILLWLGDRTAAAATAGTPDPVRWVLESLGGVLPILVVLFAVACLAGIISSGRRRKG
ncbi:MAG TPA: patatin-like protein [Symbiobacteriaceae bacterium]|jgi:patatin-related protein